MITWILLGGALSGAGVLMFVLILAPPAIQPAAALAELDSQRDERRLRQEARRLNPRERALPDWLDALGYRAAALLRRTGIDLGALNSDLSVLGRSLERHLVASLLLGLLGFGAPLLVTALGALAGRPMGSLPLLACLVLGAAMAALPTARLRSRAAQARRGFRHVVGSFLDLVSMSLSAGRGVPDSRLLEVSGHYAGFDGVSPINARNAEMLEALRAELARRGSNAPVVIGNRNWHPFVTEAMRELADAEGRAGENSESMLVAQLVIAIGFIVFLVYPALSGIMGGG